MRGWPKQSGYCVITDPLGPTIEYDTITCGHCNRLFNVKPFETPGGCTCCDKMLCQKCQKAIWDGGKCDPMENKLLRMEASAKLRESMRES